MFPWPRGSWIRVYGAKAHWRKKHDASKVVPLMVDALNREKYQSYYYPEIQSTALAVVALIGPDAASSLPVLDRLITDPNPAVVKGVRETRERIRGAAELKSL